MDFFGPLHDLLRELPSPLLGIVLEYAASTNEQLMLVAYNPTRNKSRVLHNKLRQVRQLGDGFSLVVDCLSVYLKFCDPTYDDYDNYDYDVARFPVLRGAWNAMVVAVAVAVEFTPGPAAFFLHGDSWFMIQRDGDFTLMLQPMNVSLLTFRCPWESARREEKIFKVFLWDERRVVVLYKSNSFKGLTVLDLDAFTAKHCTFNGWELDAEDITFDSLTSEVHFHHVCLFLI